MLTIINDINHLISLQQPNRPHFNFTSVPLCPSFSRLPRSLGRSRPRQRCTWPSRCCWRTPNIASPSRNTLSAPITPSARWHQRSSHLGWQRSHWTDSVVEGEGGGRSWTEEVEGGGGGWNWREELEGGGRRWREELEGGGREDDEKQVKR